MWKPQNKGNHKRILFFRPNVDTMLEEQAQRPERHRCIMGKESKAESDRHQDKKQFRIKSAFIPALAKAGRQLKVSNTAVVNLLVREGLVSRGLLKEDAV